MTLYQFIFYAFAAVLLGSGVMVVAANNAIKSALFLVLSFFCSAVLWMLLQAEFLALALIFVYVGAVMTLFLFVVMMLKVDTTNKDKNNFVRYLPFGLVVVVMFVTLMIVVVGPKRMNFPQEAPSVAAAAETSNVKALGSELYTNYVYEFELAAIILLVAIIAAISLAHRGRKNNKSQSISEQVKVEPERRIHLVKMPSEKQ